MSGEERATAEERQIVLVRHAETEWSAQGRHTGRTDLPLTSNGRQVAAELSKRLSSWRFQSALVSPLRRARETCSLCGLDPIAQVLDCLAEWDYGEYEGLTTPQIRQRRPGWLLWSDGCPGGEDAAQVGMRADRAIEALLDRDGDTVVFSHGHVLRVLAARWMELAPETGGRLMLGTAGISVLGWERGMRAIATWNEQG